MDPLFDFTGKVALVTGGSRGLGYQMVKAFAERGADVIIASRKLDACEAAAEEVRKLGRRAPARIGALSEVDALFTDRPLPEPLARACAAWSCEVHVAA